MKRTISTLLCLALLLSISPVFGVNAASSVTTTVPWDGRTSEPFAGGTGTADDPYQIANGAQLYYLTTSTTADTYFELTNNINLGDKLFPMISDFSGTLDGKGYRILNLNILNSASTATGFTQNCSGTIKNLTLEGKIESSSSYCGAFAGYINGGEISDCANYCDIVSTGSYTGGIVGYIDSSGSVTRCINRGSITAKSYTGGICGQTILEESTNRIAISSCTNIGNVSGSSYVGGILGYQYGLSVRYCANTGDISGTGSYIGGIVGAGSNAFCFIMHSYTASVISKIIQRTSYIYDCYNVGNITGSSAVGGIAGSHTRCVIETEKHDSRTSNEARIVRAYNLGKLITSSSSCGDICGDGNITCDSTYYLSGNNASATNAFGTARSEAEMMGVGAYANFDFNSVWTWDDSGNYDYPILQSIGLPPIVCNHEYSLSSTSASCVSSGVQTYLCNKCQDCFIENASALGHDILSYGAQEPTCTEVGWEAYIACSRCDYTTYSELSALGHSIATDPAVSASCTEDGLTEGRHCTRCDGATVEQQVIPAYGHDYKTVITPPTCADDGYTTYTCSVCSHSYTDNSIDAIGHNWDKGTQTAQPSCTETGSVVYTCLTCSETRVESIPENGHSYNTIVTPPTCTEGGYTTFICSVCNHSYIGDRKDATGHNWNNGIVTVNPGCEADGKKVYACLTCGETRDEALTATGHNYIVKVTKPTCTEAGYTTRTCSACGDSYKDTYVGATGHAWNNGIEMVKATCTTAGEKVYTCGNCGEIKSEAITPFGHSYSATITAPTCTEAGYTTYTCSTCGDTYLGDTVAATGHSYTAKITNPTCTKEGFTAYTCSACGDTYTGDTVAATGHNYSEKVTAPTCTEAGFTTYTCTECGHSYAANAVPATGHSFNKGNCTLCNAEDPDYVIPNPFVDVKEGDYFYDPVLWAVKEGVTTGTSATTFGPEKPCTRGQVVTFLWRACGSPEPTKADNPFSDVSESAYYYKAVLWAVEQGITTGVSKTSFGPDKTCTRGQVATFLWRAQGKPTPTTTTNPFTDIKEADYYYSAVLWAVEEGITNGTGKGLFSPDKDCTRGQIVTFLYRALS